MMVKTMALTGVTSFLFAFYFQPDVYAAESDFTKAFYDDAKLNLNSTLYIRQRAVKNNATGKYGMGPGGIRNQTGNIALDYQSGYWKDVLGVDFWGNGNIRLGHTVGQSEVLYYDYDCRNDGSFNPCEKSYVAVTLAALKVKLGDDNTGFKLSGGYTTINSGTIKNSWGLNPHAYRGVDSALSLNSVKLTYAWADQFKNDWSQKFSPMTTSWHQNNAAGLEDNGKVIKAGNTIPYIHSAGLVYEPGSVKFDLGIGEGKDYRRNWQIQVDHTAALFADAVLKSRLFYQGGRYITERSGISSPDTEYYVGVGTALTYNHFTWKVGYSQNYAPYTADYNFRLTPWANSDKRDWQPTLSQLEDYNVAGARAVRLSTEYNFAGYNLPELTVGMGGTYGWHVVSDVSKKGAERNYDGEMSALDVSMRYRIESGPAKGLSFTVLPALLRSEDTNRKTDRNDIKFIVGHSFNIF